MPEPTEPPLDAPPTEPPAMPDDLVALRDEVVERIRRMEDRVARRRIAAEFRAAAQAITDSGGTVHDPLATAIWGTCHQASSAPAVIDDPCTIAIAAYRHLADRLEGDTS